MSRGAVKQGLHPRNRFRSGYDFPALVLASPALARFVAPHAHGELSINYADPSAVKALNQALLKQAYGIASWDLPGGSLCPPIPGRCDYVHHLADLLAGAGDASIPRGASVRVLDVGVGANCIYPLLGASEYGWSFVGTDVDPASLRWAQRLARAQAPLAGLIEFRLQPVASQCFAGVVRPGEHFAASMCNPPFHASAAAAATGTLRKVRNLRGAGATRAAARPVLNFGGRAGELWCPGGELGFIRRMIGESAMLPRACRWFTSLVSKSVHLPPLYQALKYAGARDVRTIGMAQGRKASRILAWSFEPREASAGPRAAALG